MVLTRVKSVDPDVQFVALVATTSAATQLVAATAGKSIYVQSLALVANLAMNVQFFSATTAISGILNLNTIGSGFVLGQNKDGWLKTNSGQALNITPSVSGTVGGMFTYVAK